MTVEARCQADCGINVSRNSPTSGSNFDRFRGPFWLPFQLTNTRYGSSQLYKERDCLVVARQSLHVVWYAPCNGSSWIEALRLFALMGAGKCLHLCCRQKHRGSSPTTLVINIIALLYINYLYMA
jgi:hypothetical protein